MRKAENILRHELIGLPVEVVEATNPNDLGIQGEIVDETRKSLVIDQDGTRKRLLKNRVELQLELKEEKVNVKGNLLIGRPWERLKKKFN